MDGARAYTYTSCDLYLNGEKLEGIPRPHWKVVITGKLQASGNVLCVKLAGRPSGGDYPLSGLLDCALWIQPEPTLSPSFSLLGEWQAVSGDWVTSHPVTLTAIPTKLTDDGYLKPGVSPMTANHLVRDVDIPAAWQGKQVYMHLVSPQMNTSKARGLTWGMLLINGQARLLETRPNIPLDQMINLTPFLKFGQPNRIELWNYDSRQGTMTEEAMVINDITIGCGAQ
jgi:hypothetical protein